MNILINNFIEYLLSIGILSKELVCRFNAMNSTRDDNKNLIDDFIDQMSKSLLNYLNSLSIEQKNILTQNIVKQFLVKKNTMKKSKLKDLIYKLSSKTILNLKSFFQKWKYSTSLNTIQSISYLNSKRRILSSDNLLNNKHIKQNINQNTKKPSSPKYESENKSIMEIIPHHNKVFFNIQRDKIQYHPLKENFFQRQKSLLKRRKEHVQSLNFGNELHLSNSCTFIPSINENTNQLTSSLSYTSSFIRLYYDNQYRMSTYINNQRQEEERIKLEANRKVFKNLDNGKIEKLYNDYKEKRLNQKNLRKKYDEENGITYKPFILHGKYYKRVNSTFKNNKNNKNEIRNYSNSNKREIGNYSSKSSGNYTIKKNETIIPNQNKKKINEGFKRLSSEKSETTSQKLKSVKNLKKSLKYIN